MSTLNFLATALAAATLSLPAQAVSNASASVSLSSVNLTLIPLGAGPTWINFMSTGYAENYGAATAQFNRGPDNDYQSASFQSSSGPWYPGSAAAASVFSGSSSQIAGDGQLSTMSMSSSAYATFPGTVYNCAYFGCSIPTSSANGSAQAPGGSAFVVSPNTIVLFTAQATVSAAANEGGVFSTLNWDNTIFTNYYGNAANASAFMYVSGPAAGGGSGNQNSSDSRSTYANSYWDGAGWVNAGAVDSGAMGVSFANLTGAEMQGSFVVTDNSWSYA